jgi:hypothetical protein
MNARRASMFLYMIARMRPQIWDAINPHGPKVSRAAREYMISIALKGFSSELGNRVDTKKLAGIQQTLVKFASDYLASEYVDDDWCGTLGKIPIPVPGPTPWSSYAEVMLNPQPLPPAELQKEIGGYLLLLSEATSHQDVAKDLQSIGDSLLR